MKRIYILGVNGNARDVLDAIHEIRRLQPDFFVPGGFLDDRVPKGTVINGLPVVGALSDAKSLSEAVFVNAIGSPVSYPYKKELIQRTGILPEAFVNVIHPQASLSPSVILGRGLVILSHSSIGSGVRVGNHVMILQNSVISHDSVIEDYAVLATGVCVSGEVKIQENCYLGSQVSIKGGIELGKGSLVGMGSVVLKNIPEKEVWCGNPAHFLKKVAPAPA